MGGCFNFKCGVLLQLPLHLQHRRGRCRHACCIRLDARCSCVCVCACVLVCSCQGHALSQLALCKTPTLHWQPESEAERQRCCCCCYRHRCCCCRSYCCCCCCCGCCCCCQRFDFAVVDNKFVPGSLSTKIKNIIQRRHRAQ